MIVGHSVQLALDVWHAARQHKDERRKVYGEAAMLYACNALDGTARVKSGARDGNARRFTQTIRADLDIFEYIGMPGIDLHTTRFPYAGVKSQGSDGGPDIADVLYYVHRCAHGHGDGVNDGFDLHPTDGNLGNHSMQFTNTGVRLPESAILGLVAIAVLAPENAGHRAWGARIPWAGGVLDVDEWWGRGEDFRALAKAGGRNYYKLNVTPVEDANTPLSEIAEGILKRTFGHSL